MLQARAYHQPATLGRDGSDADVGDVEAVAEVEPGQRQRRLSQRQNCSVRHELAAFEVEVFQFCRQVDRSSATHTGTHQERVMRDCLNGGCLRPVACGSLGHPLATLSTPLSVG